MVLHTEGVVTFFIIVKHNHYDREKNDKFKDIPMRDLIGGPLFAAAEAQEKLASTAWDYYQRIAYETDENGNPTNKTRTLDFEQERAVTQDGVAGETTKQTLEASN